MPYKNFKDYIRNGTRTYPHDGRFYCNDHKRMVNKQRIVHLKAEHEYVQGVGYVKKRGT